jgi:hypothetical protein
MHMMHHGGRAVELVLRIQSNNKAQSTHPHQRFRVPGVYGQGDHAYSKASARTAFLHKRAKRWVC